MAMAEAFHESSIEYSTEYTPFGDEAKILESMESGKAEILGSIDDLYQGLVTKHQNIVEIAQIENFGPEAPALNKSETVLVQGDEGQELLCVFKPAAGENPNHKSDFPHRMYPREYAAYLVSQHFGFNLVPPTILRTIDDRLGSLQLFMPPPRYLPANKVMNEIPPEEYDVLTASDDIRKLHLLDYILANPDRHRDNFLFEVEENGEGLSLTKNDGGQPHLIAIDHGLSFDERYYMISSLLDVTHGPYTFLSYNNMSKSPQETPIEDKYFNMVERGLGQKDSLNLRLQSIEGLEPEQLEKMWQRVNDLHQHRCYLSPENIKQYRKTSLVG